MSLFRKRCPFTQSSCEVPSVPRIEPLLKILTHTHPLTSQKHGKSQAESGGQVSHRGSLTGNVGSEEWGVRGFRGFIKTDYSTFTPSLTDTSGSRIYRILYMPEIGRGMVNAPICYRITGLEAVKGMI